ncbi:hypothetical protein [Gloeobacter morelensis]|uniref:hypothetical protein n=1 Tax=Gloeobacter morelensis TaxID=2907343 RepID=UPI001E30F0D3|nr:hypothetical protein [Gloeobacter morelensis]UFP97263.1 hypothetical protein ISF26_24385 [Gloeobacter morelensis MG652769]
MEDSFLSWFLRFLQLDNIGGWVGMYFLVTGLNAWVKERVLPFWRRPSDTDAQARRELEVMEAGLKEAEYYYGRPDFWYRLVGDVLIAVFCFAFLSAEVVILKQANTQPLTPDTVVNCFLLLLALAGTIGSTVKLSDLWLLATRLGRYEAFKEKTQAKIAALRRRLNLPQLPG